MMDNQVFADVSSMEAVEESAQQTLGRWRQEGAQLIAHNYNHFVALLDKATLYRDKRQYSLAATYASMAANWPVSQHCGFFCSGRLEELLLDLGKRAVPASPPYCKPLTRAGLRKNVLHVCTLIGRIGGLTRMLRRWIEQDPENCHSIALTRQTWRNIPADLMTAVGATGGHVYQVNASPGALLSWARQLRNISQRANIDLVILHIGNGDIVPLLAFADKNGCPPVVLLDHADHLFWAGAGISDVVISLRESGMRLAQSRRGIEPHRNVLLPIPLDPTDRTLARHEAKKALGFPINQVMLLSTARSVKYRSLDSLSYADIHASILEKYKNVNLVVVGSGVREDWADAAYRAEGRILMLDASDDISLYQQAADIYVDSFPFVSNTSLLEAASFGVPVVTIYPYSDAGEILGADMPGLSGCIVRARTFRDYSRELGKLIEDDVYRMMIGNRLEKQVRALHTGAGWLRHLREIYNVIDKTSKPIKLSLRHDEPYQDEPDVFIQRMFGADCAAKIFSTVEREILVAELRSSPLHQRLRIICWLLPAMNSLSIWMACFRRCTPEWILCRRMRYDK